MKKADAVNAVKNKLRSYGYKVEDMSKIDLIAFDLLVNKKIRLIVGQRKLLKIPEKCDVYAWVGHVVIFFEKKDGDTIIMMTSPYGIFGRP